MAAIWNSKQEDLLLSFLAVIAVAVVAMVVAVTADAAGIGLETTLHNALFIGCSDRQSPPKSEEDSTEIFPDTLTDLDLSDGFLLPLLLARLSRWLRRLASSEMGEDSGEEEEDGEGGPASLDFGQREEEQKVKKHGTLPKRLVSSWPKSCGVPNALKEKKMKICQKASSYRPSSPPPSYLVVRLSGQSPACDWPGNSSGRTAAAARNASSPSAASNAATATTAAAKEKEKILRLESAPTATATATATAAAAATAARNLADCRKGPVA